MPSLGNHVDAVFIPESVNTSTTLRINGGDLHLDDGKKALFGQGDDLQIYHDGSNSYIENTTGSLYIRDNGNNIYIQGKSGESSGIFRGNGAVELYYDNSIKLETTSTGVTVTGTALATALSTGAAGTGINISTGTITGPATLTIDPAAIGDDTGLVIVKGDFQVDGTTTTINSTTLTIDDKNIVLASGAVDSAAADGAGVTVDGADATLLYKSTPDAWSFNKNVGIGTDSPGANLQITSDAPGILFQDANSGSTESKIEGLSGHLYYTTDNANRDHVFAATGGSESLRITGDGNVRIPDNGKFTAGDNDDLQISHDGATSIISGMYHPIEIRHQSEVHIKCVDDGTVELYHDNIKKLETTTAGVTVTGALEVSAATNITVGGTALPSLTNLLGGSLDGTLGSVTMAYLPAAPSSPVQGQFYFNSLSSKAQIYTGSSFVDLVPSGGGGGGGGGSSTDANATFRKYTYSISSTTSSVSGSSDLVTSAGSFVTGRKYTIKTVGTTDFTAIGASANTVGVVFDATGAGSGSGDAFDTLVYSTADNKNVEVYVNGVKAVEGATNDYVATSGTSVNFVANLASGDVVDIQVYELLTNDAFVLATGGTFSGNVGINTSTINNRLHIHSNANEQGILLTQDGDNYSAIISDANRSAANQHLLAIEGHWNGTPVAEISLRTGSDTTNKDDGIITFRTSSANNLNASERMRIDSSGNVGIGTNDPKGSLHIADTGAVIYLHETDAPADNRIWAYSASSEELVWQARNDSYGGGGNLFKMTRTGNSIDTFKAQKAGATWFVIDNLSKKVGIGTDAPTTELDVFSDTFSDITISSARTTGNIGGINFRKDVTGTSTSMAQVYVTTTGEYILKAGGVDASDEAIHIKADGNVGIGTADPTYKLHVQGDIRAQNGALILSYSDGGNIDHLWHDDAAEYGTTGSFVFNSDTTYKNSTGGTWSNIKVGHVYVDNGNLGTTVGNIQDLARFYANNGNATSIRIQAKRKVAGTNWNSAGYKIFCHTDSTEQGYIEFNPHTTAVGDGNYDVAIGSTAGEIVRFGNSGNVGIGTNDPGVLLDLYGATDTSGSTTGTTLLRLTNNVGNDISQQKSFIDFSFLDINPNEIPQVRIGAEVGTNVDANNQTLEGNGAFVVYTNNADTDGSSDTAAGASLAERMRVDHSGNVGIGTNNPDAKLEVNGEIRIRQRTADVPARLTFKSAVLNQSPTARIEFWESNDVGATGASHCFIEYDGAPVRSDGNTGNPGSLLIKGINDDGSNQVFAGFTRKSITYFNSKVGIDTDIPDSKLHINGGAANYTPTSSGTGLFKVSGGGSSIYSMFIGIDNDGGYFGHNGSSRKLFFQTNEATRMTIDASGNVGIGTVTPDAKLDIYGGTDALWLHKTTNGGGVGIAFSDHQGSSYAQQGYLRFLHADGASFGHNAAFAFTTTETSTGSFTVYSSDDFTAVGTLTENYSDERLKTIHGRIDNPLEKLSKIHGYYYTQNETADELGFKEKGQRQVGVSAQEIQEVLPEVIRVAPISYTDKTDEEYYTVQYNRVVPLLIESIKAQQEIIEKLQQRLDNAGL